MSTTLAGYAEIAPTVMDGAPFTKTQIENKLALVPTKPEAQPDPEISNQTKVALFNAVFAYPSLKDFHEQTGKTAGSLAIEYGLKKHQIKTLISEMQAMLGYYRNNNES